MNNKDDFSQVPTPRSVGKYELVRVLGRGGMGEVWLAHHKGPGGFTRKVAIKLLPAKGRDTELLRRLVREARLLAKMEHPNIVSLYDFDRDEKTNMAYLAFEYVPGMDLSRIMALAKLSGIPLDLNLISYVARECLAGLGYAHGLRDEMGSPLEIVHRDISPSNVLCSVTGQVKLTDFGIARWRAASGATTEEFIVGKVPYMSPEQVDGLPLDLRTDLWSFGVVLYELITGRLPFTGRTPVEKMAQILGADIPPIRGLRPDIPQWLEELVNRLLTRNRDERIQTAADALGVFVAHRTGNEKDGADGLAALMRTFQREASAAPTQSISVKNTDASISQNSPGMSLPDEQSSRPSPPPPPSSPAIPVQGRPQSILTSQEAVPSATMDVAVGNTAPRWATSERLGITVSIERQDMGPKGAAGHGRDEPPQGADSGPVGPADSAQVRRGGILDAEEPLVDSMGVLRRVVLSMEGLSGPREECWLRSLPASLSADVDGLEEFKKTVQQAWAIADKPGSRLGRCLATSGGLLYPSDDENEEDVPVDRTGRRPAAYHIITEPGAIPLRRFLEQTLGTRISLAVAAVSPIMDLSNSESHELTAWLKNAWRLALGVDLVSQLAWALSQWHEAGGAHGALTPFAILVMPKQRQQHHPDVLAAAWKTRSSACLPVTGTPRIMDVGLGPWLREDLNRRIQRLGLDFSGGKIVGDLSRLSPEQVDAALDAAAGPLHLYGAPETVRQERQPGQADDLAFCGVLLYDILTGRYPFQARSGYSTLSRAIDPTFVPSPPSRWNHLVSEALDYVVTKTLSRDPGQRYQTAGELALDLEDLRYEAEHVLAER